MAPKSPSVSEFSTKREATDSPLLSLPSLSGTQDNQAIEAALKEISSQLRSNNKHLKKLRREVKDSKKHLKKLLQEVQDNRNEIHQRKKRMDAMAYNNMARIINQGLTDDDSEFMPLQNPQNKVIKVFPLGADDYHRMTEKESDHIAKELDFPFFTYTEGWDKPRNLLQAIGWGGDVLALQEEWSSRRAGLRSLRH